MRGLRKLAGACLLFVAPCLRATEFSVVYLDGPGFGYNDTSPAAPVGGNPGTTLGQQRRNVLEHALEIWTDLLDSEVTIVVEADFVQLGGTDRGATLASAGPTFVYTAFPGAPRNDLWYVSALADNLAGADQGPGDADLGISVNESVDSDPTVLGGDGFYYGYDHEAGSQANLLSTLLHEIAHGLGFLTTVDDETGAFLDDRPDSFTVLMKDESTGKFWDEMTAAERAASITNEPDLVFAGPAATEAARFQLKPEGSSSESAVRVSSLLPPSAALDLSAENATFGRGLPPWGLEGAVVLVDDGVAPSADACEEPFLNAAGLRGRIALVDRGGCTFVEKVRRAQEAGAIAVIVANNAGDDLISMGGTNPAVEIPAVFVGQSDGEALKAALPGLVVRLENRGPLAGTRAGLPRLFAPDPVDSGSSASHWSVEAYPDLLMEPLITEGVLPQLDLTLPALRDIGWKIRNVDLPHLSYALWAEESIGGTLDGRNDDADQDGWTNFAEYAFGSDPEAADSFPEGPAFRSVDGAALFELSYRRNALASEAVFGLAAGTDLNDPFTELTKGAGFIEYEFGESDPTAPRTVRLRIESMDTRRFFTPTARDASAD